MPEVTIRFRDDGPLVINGPITLLDAEGNALQLPTEKPAIALCRCGVSENKPFCDGSHRTGEFKSEIRASSS
jgi:CDGSH-type Zn-finger protein